MVTIIFWNPFILPVLRAIIGISAHYLGDRARYTYRLFWFLKPRLLEVQTLDELRSRSKDPVTVQSYDQLEADMQSGDIILLVGNNEKHYYVAEKWGTWSMFTHIGMIMRRDDELFLLEVVLEGVTLKPLRDRIEEYPSRLVAYRKLDVADHIDRDAILWDMYEEMKDTDYENKGRPQMSPLEIFKAAVDIYIPFTDIDLLDNKENLDELFCSEIISEGYMRMDILARPPEAPASNEYVPSDFSTYTHRRKPEMYYLNHLSDAKLEDEIFIRKDNIGLLAADKKYRPAPEIEN